MGSHEVELLRGVLDWIDKKGSIKAVENARAYLLGIDADAARRWKYVGLRGCANCQHPPHGPTCSGEPGDPCDCVEPEIVYACSRCGCFQTDQCICYAR